MGLVVGHLRSLARFSGREARQPFWLWVLTVVAATMIAWMGYFVVLIRRIEQFAAANPDQVTRTVGPGSYSVEIKGSHPEIGSLFSSSALVLAAIAGVAIVLLAAAVARRLHDSGRSGWWGVPTPVLLITGLLVMSRAFIVMSATPGAAGADGPPVDFAWFGAMMLCNLMYLASLVMLIVLCCQPSQPGANHFGTLTEGNER